MCEGPSNNDAEPCRYSAIGDDFRFVGYKSKTPSQGVVNVPAIFGYGYVELAGLRSVVSH